MSGAWTPGPWEADRTCVRNCGEQHRFTCGLTRTAYATQDEMRANANLIAAAPDHAFIGWAMCVQDATWEEWGDGKGEFCFAGLRHATTLDEFGCPVLTDHLRALIAKARGETA